MTDDDNDWLRSLDVCDNCLAYFDPTDLRKITIFDPIDCELETKRLCQACRSRYRM